MRFIIQGPLGSPRFLEVPLGITIRKKVPAWILFLGTLFLTVIFRYTNVNNIFEN
jgi:hypothetical protein